MARTNGTGLSLKAGMLLAVKRDVETIFPLQPPPREPSKYYIAKIAQAVANELPLFERSVMDLMRKHAKKNEVGDPIITTEDLGNGTHAAKPEIVDMAAYLAEKQQLDEAVVVIPGVPGRLSRADFADCPIPQGAYTRMLGVIIEDTPPEGSNA